MALADSAFARGTSLFKLVASVFLVSSSWGQALAAIPLEDDGLVRSPKPAPPRGLLESSTSFLCYRNQVQCPSGIQECFDLYTACNGVNDCSDGSDEAPNFCATYFCPSYQVKCPSNLCTNTYPFPPHQPGRKFLCDGIQDCPDNSDEDPSFCNTYDCASEGDLTCPGVKQCIPPLSTANIYNQYDGPIVPPNIPTTICDGVKDCSDGSDEGPALCSSYVCPDNSFKCGDICIGIYRVCNGIVDCADGSDEAPSLCGPSYDCTKAGLVGGYQHCPSGVGCYVGPQLNCNGYVDCLDGSDENSTLCSSIACPAGIEIKCPSGVGCVGPSFLCDGNYNCLDKSDERADVCANVTCSSTQVKCPSGNGGCLLPYMICDGQTENCIDGSDESDATCSTYDCGPDTTRCPSGIGCVSNIALCDGIPGNGASRCKDGSDEDPAYCASHLQCPGYGGQIRCKNGTCIPGELCDGVTSCADESDEDPSYCKTASCPINEQKCADGIHCVDQEYALCNGIVDCPDGSDESPSFCSTYQCNAIGNFLTKCPGGSGQCIIATFLCDGVNDCTDGSDESLSFCASYNCSEGRFKCPGTNACVSGALCNGYPDCPDQSDEASAICNSALPPSPESPPPVSASPPESPGSPPPTDSGPPAAPPGSVAGAPPPCDPTGSFPNQCFNAPGNASICCPGQCPTTPGNAPACGALAPSPPYCDPTSATPNQCFNNDGSQWGCCAGVCPDNPGPSVGCKG